MSATIVLGAAGLMFGPVGMVAGIALGSYIDREYLFPMLFQDVSGGEAGFEDQHEDLCIGQICVGSNDFPFHCLLQDPFSIKALAVIN